MLTAKIVTLKMLDEQGAYKRYNAMFLDFDTVICIKVRLLVL